MKTFGKYNSESRDYALLPAANKNEGNCHSIVSSILVGVGVAPKSMALPVWGARPGYGYPLLKEMLR